MFEYAAILSGETHVEKFQRCIVWINSGLMLKYEEDAPSWQKYGHL